MNRFLNILAPAAALVFLAGCATTQSPTSNLGTTVGGVASQGTATTTVGNGQVQGTVIQRVSDEPGVCYFRLVDGRLAKDACPPDYDGL